MIRRCLSSSKIRSTQSFIVNPAMISGTEFWAVKKNDTQKLHTTEMRMLRWARGKTKKDHVKNGHVLRKKGEDTTKKMLDMQVQ